MAERLEQAGAPAAQWHALVDRGLALLGPRRDFGWARLRLLVDPVATEQAGSVRTGRWLGQDPEVLAVVAGAGDERDVARAVTAWEWRDADEVAELVERATRARDPIAAVRYLETAGRGLAFRLGDLSGAVAVYQRLHDAADATGSIRSRAEALGHLAMCRALLGELDTAADTQRAFTELTGRLEPVHRLRLLAVTNDTVAHYLRGTEPDRAVTEQLVAQATSGAAGALPFGWIMAGFAALRLALHGDVDGVRPLADGALELFERADPHRYVLGGALWVVSTALWECGLGDHSVGERSVGKQGAGEHGAGEHGLADLAPRAAAVLARLDAAGVGLGPLRSTALATGWMHTLAGRLDLARPCFARARADFADTGHRPFVAIAAHGEAVALRRLGRPDDPAAAELDVAAARGFGDLGMTGWPRRRPSTAAPSSPAPAPPDALPITPRERTVLALVVSGRTNAEIATDLHLSVATVERHLSNLYPKLGARNRAQAAAIARAAGLGADGARVSR